MSEASSQVSSEVMEEEVPLPELEDTEGLLEFVGSKWNVGEKWAEYLECVYNEGLPDLEELDANDWASLIHEGIHCAAVSSFSSALSQHVKEYGYPWAGDEFWDTWNVDSFLTQVVSGIVYSLGALTSIVVTVISLEEATCEDLLIELAVAADENVFSEANVNWPTLGSFVGSFLSRDKGKIPSIHDFLDLLKDLNCESE